MRPKEKNKIKKILLPACIVAVLILVVAVPLIVKYINVVSLWIVSSVISSVPFVTPEPS
jgi:hypothetical protein